MLANPVKIAYNRGVIIEPPALSATSRFLLPKTSYTDIIDLAYLVTETTPNGVASLAALHTKWAFFIAQYTTKKTASNGLETVSSLFGRLCYA